jgi:membrane-associated phospholipid phosphatase
MLGSQLTKRARQLGAALLFSLAVGEPLLAQVDTVPRIRQFTWRDLAIIEAFAIMAVAAAPLDRRMALRLQDSTAQRNRLIRRTATFVRTVADPGSVLIGVGMYTYGKLRKNERAADLGLHGTEALAVGEVIGVVLKGVIGRARPYVNIDNPHDYQLFRGFGSNGAYRSMPSGHTIAAFAAASAVTSETSRWWPSSVWYIAPVMYGGAAAAGVSRMYSNAHWASDVATGAAVGTMAGIMVVRWHHSHPGNVTDRFFLGASLREGFTSGGRAALQFSPIF